MTNMKDIKGKLLLKMEDSIKKSPFLFRQGFKYIYGAIPPRFRYGKVFWNTYNFLQESQWWNREKLDEYQMQQLSKLLQHAYKNVPYYQRIFDEKGLKPQNIQSLDDLRKIPYLTKEIVQKNFTDLVSLNYPKSRLQYVTTGGSTGKPMGFYYDKDISAQIEWAFMVTQWNRIGYQIGDRRIILRGNIVRGKNKRNFWEYNPLEKVLILSSYHMTDEILSKYVKKIREFVPKFIHGYPSVITILSKFMKKNKIESFSSVKGVLCSSENLYSFQRELLKKVFKCRIYSWYGLSEYVALGGECEESNDYHVFPEYGVVELIDKDNKLVTKEDGIGEIVATGLNNFVFPLIRYKTGDLGIRTNYKCSCGRNYSLLKQIEGRLQDLIVTEDGRLISLTSLIFAQHFEAFAKIEEMQLVQEKQGEVIIKIVKSFDYSNKDELEISSKIRNCIGNGLDIFFDYVDHIPCTQIGKFRFLLQKLPIEFGDSK